MDEDKISSIVKENYNIELLSIEKIKNIYKVISKEGTFCVKVIKYEFSHFKFILSAILHAQARGFFSTPEIIKTNKGLYFINFFNKYAYLTKWINGRESNFNNPVELGRVAIKLGELHRCSEGFTVTKDMKPRIGWFTWITVFNTRINEMLDFKNRISQKAYLSEFDKIYLECINEEVARAKRAIEGIEKSKYMKCMERSVLRRGFCHHDFACHNVIRDYNGNFNVIDFDYCLLDTHIHDLSSLMIRGMKNGKWSVERGQNIIKNYKLSNSVSSDELDIMKEFIRFPQEFWQIGIQKYWEQQPWTEETFINRIDKIVSDRECREEFIEVFFL
jgi:CotS family spore coat protein